MKHTEVPHQLDNLRLENKLEQGDKVIYAAIRQYMNKDTRECYPSYTTICKLLDISRKKLSDALKRLFDTKLLEKRIIIEGEKKKNNIYYFPETEFDKQFEMFTPEFLSLDLPVNVKEYYMDIQRFLYKKDTGVGILTLPNYKLAKITGLSPVSVKKYNTILIDRGILTEDVTEGKDEYGLPVIQKNFNLTGLNQAALWVKAVTEQVQANTNDIEDLKQSNEELKQSNEELRREIELLKKEQARLRNATPTPVQYSL